MNKFEELWQFPAFRWCVYQALLLPLPLLISIGMFNSNHVNADGSVFNATYEFTWDAWLVILVLPAVLVWRKSLFSWLYKEAEDATPEQGGI